MSGSIRFCRNVCVQRDGSYDGQVLDVFGGGIFSQDRLVQHWRNRLQKFRSKDLSINPPPALCGEAARHIHPLHTVFPIRCGGLNENKVHVNTTLVYLDIIDSVSLYRVQRRNVCSRVEELILALY